MLLSKSGMSGDFGKGRGAHRAVLGDALAGGEQEAGLAEKATVRVVGMRKTKTRRTRACWMSKN